MGNDRTSTGRALTVAQAAEALGITAEAVRSRIKRRTLRTIREGGHVFVVLEDADRAQPVGDRARQGDDPSPDRPGESGALISQMQARIDSLERQLERQLEQATERDRENRRIIAALTSRIPELPPAEEAPRNILEHLEDEEYLREERSMKTRPDEQRQRWHSDRYQAPRGSPEPAEQEPERTEPRSHAPGAQEGVQRPWWRRMFGG